MVLTKMRKILRTISFLVLIVSFSCEKQGLIVNCSTCTADEPFSTDLMIKLDTRYNKGVVINVYEGNLEDSVLYTSINGYTDKTSVPVLLSKKYTVTATYAINGIHCIAVDSATPRVRYEKNQCNNPCYFVYDTSIDLRLKQL